MNLAKTQASSDNQPVPHVGVCVCTFRRPSWLLRLLEALARQKTDGRCTFSITVVDNDRAESARAVVEGFAATVSLRVRYCNEPRQNIALARNRAIAASRGEYIAFLDDDERPEPDWLRLMIETCQAHAAAGVLGPVRPYFDSPPPRWLIQGRFCERPEHPTGTIMPWHRSRTGNLLFRREILTDVDEPFRAQFGAGGEDVDFFHRMSDRDCLFVWCNEAVAYEIVPPSRWTRRYMFQRALLRGRSNLKLRAGRTQALVKSFVALPAYTLVLPGTLLLGQHVFVRYGIKFCDHLGRVLALIGLNPVRERPL